MADLRAATRLTEAAVGRSESAFGASFENSYGTRSRVILITILVRRYARPRIRMRSADALS